MKISRRSRGKQTSQKPPARASTAAAFVGGRRLGFRQAEGRLYDQRRSSLFDDLYFGAFEEGLRRFNDAPDLVGATLVEAMALYFVPLS